jgi:glycyl-tRNA synthetase
MRIPFGAIQIGKAFRNEITPGNFIFRTREFEQAEMQYFIEPGTNAEQFKNFEDAYRDFWVNKIGIKKDHLRQRDHAEDELAFYANQARDFEYKFSRGWGELQGIHDRTNYDISNHMKHS